MANILIYGQDKPKVSFVQMPDGQISFMSENKTVIDLDRIGPNRPVRWVDLSKNSLIDFFISERASPDFNPLVYGFDNSVYTQKYERFIDELSAMVGSPVEEKFLRAYARNCQTQDILATWACPALIPQVWVNWIHYDSTDPHRAERARREPFRVDFMVRHPSLGSNFVIIEIDGLSHFGNVRVNDGGGRSFNASMDDYTNHLRKDRWLRQRGWHVIRLSNQEIENYEDEFQPVWDFGTDSCANSFSSFWRYITGKAWFEDAPIPF